MDLLLKGKRALITGSSRGIGKGIAHALAKEGVTVVVHGRTKTDAQAVAEEIKEKGGKAFIAIGDLNTDESAKEVVNAALTLLGGIDILVNNAGMYYARGWDNTTPDQWAQIYNTNVISMVRMTQLLVPKMKEANWGRIILIGSAFGQYPGQIVADYSATKGATVTLGVSLAKELSHTGITVNTISPGPIVTDNFDKLVLDLAELLEFGTTDINEIRQILLQGAMQNPTGRLGTVDDVANLVSFISSPLADFINGSNLRVDGGYVPTVN